MEPVNHSPRVLGNRYEVGDILGRGGMAEVHLGRDTRLGRTVAIKLLRTDLARDPTFQARFRREAQSAAALNHPAIVAVYDTSEETVTDAVGSTVQLPYIVMEYVQGRTLREMIEAARARAMADLPPGSPPPPGAGSLDLDEALEVTSGVLSALEYSHRAGIVHRDIKPANVMVTPNGQIKVMDFGIARALADASATMTQTQAVIGTAQYLSPEQARGETVDARSDLYSAGCLLFELLTGRPPFVADSPVAVAYQHVREFPQPPSDFNPAVPEVVDRVVMHALTKDRDIRYQSALEFRDDVEAARRGQGDITAPVIGAPVAALPTEQLLPGGANDTDPFGNGTGGQGAGGYQQEKSNRGWMYAVIALALLAVAGIAGFLLVGNKHSPQQKQVPSVVGLTQAAATQAIQAEGFKAGAQNEASDTVDKGNVARQSPEASTLLDVGSTVTIWVSTGPSTATVPDLVGSTQTDALNELKAAGLTVGTTTTQDITYDLASKNPAVMSAAANTVVATSPAANQPVSPGSSVNLVLSSGRVVVPDVTGKTKDQATQILQTILQLQVSTTTQNSTRTAGTVIDQNPNGGALVDMGGKIKLTIAKALPTPTPTPTTPSPTTTSPTTSPTPTPTATTPSPSSSSP